MVKIKLTKANQLGSFANTSDIIPIMIVVIRKTLKSSLPNITFGSYAQEGFKFTNIPIDNRARI